MLRPTPASLTVSSVNNMVPIPAWLDIFRFCSISDLGASLAVDKHWRTVADSYHVWADAYERTQRVDDSSSPNGEGSLRSLIQRPFGEDAIGWHVAVLSEENAPDGSEQEKYFTGHIVAYSAETDAYLVAYSGSEPVIAWEQERRKRTAAMRHNPSLAGKSRFSFLSPPAHIAPGQSSASSESEKARAVREEVSSWKQELKHNVLHAPRRQVTQLKDHSDEVLFVVFSPCGTRLASCSRDLRTIVFKVSYHHSDDEMDRRIGSQASRPLDPAFEREAIFTHQTAPCRAIWWPIPPYDMVAVSTEDAGAGWQASKVEIWQIGPSPNPETPPEGDTVEAEYPLGVNAHCIFQCHNRPFDIYAAIFPWPPSAGDSENPEDLHKSLCFLAGWAVLRENEHYVQWLNVWPGPLHPSFDSKAPLTANGAPKPLARLRLEGEMNYLHCLEVGPAVARDRGRSRQILAMTGSMPHLCNEIGLMDLDSLQRRGDGFEGLPEGEVPSALPKVYDVGVKVHSMGERVVLSAKWNAAGDFILLNTRPYATKGGGTTVSEGDTFEDLLVRPAPDLSTRMELLLLDAASMDVLSVFDGHFAFTTKESPFLIFTEEWANSDFVASGGEDHRVYVWHRRHRRLVRRLCGHTEPVNAVSWNGKGLLASASDDHSVIIWTSGTSRKA